MAIGDDIIQPIPAVGSAGTSYASQIVAFLQEVKSRLEAKVPLTSILVSLLDMANNAIANLSYLSLYEQESSPSTPIGSLQNFQGDLWWVSESGAAQITSGNNLNAASLGAIGGDYGGANPASFRFSDADETFYAYDDFGALDWAWLGARGINIYGEEDSTTRVRLTAAAGVANQTITIPAALPAAQTLIQMEAGGDLVYSNTLPNNTSITLQGTGKIKHGTYILPVPLNSSTSILGAGSSGIVSGGGGIPGAVIDASTIAYFPLFGVDATKTITGFTVYNHGAPGGNAVYTLVADPGDGTWLSTGITVTTSSQIPMASGSFSMATGLPLFLKVQTPGGGGMRISYIDLNFTSA